MLRRIVKLASVIGAVLGVGAAGAGCLDRPVTSNGATTKTNFTASVTQNAINKVDILFDIDNSASMGDKQEFLAAAVPDLITRLVQPNCVTVDANTGASTVQGLSSAGSCSAFPGSTIEFPPVHDMHIGVISSSLGTRGVTGDGVVCDPSASSPQSKTNGGAPFTTPPVGAPGPAIPSHVDDQAHLLARTATTPTQETAMAPSVGGQDFLDWFPTGPSWPANAMKTAEAPNPALSPPASDIMDAPTLENDFDDLVIGAHYYGCGIESQLESWYRFLVQPDPYESISTASGAAQWVGYDATIIQQRHDFLRPDSLVAIIVMSDENDSEIDVRSFGGSAVQFMDQNYPPPKGTSACSGPNGPGDPSCTSCEADKTDSNCKGTGGAIASYTAENDWGFYINVRHVHMKEKYGIDPQYPLGRYVLGLSSPTVPDRDHEYPMGASCYAGGVGDGNCNALKAVDTSMLNCTNPLFAATLPDGSATDPTTLCNAKGSGGTRTADLIFYAHIGGVPHQLLQTTHADGSCPASITDETQCPQKDSLTPSDWTKILGQGWETLPSPAAITNVNQFNYMGIDTHMIESYAPRNPLITNTAGPGPRGGGSENPVINGGEWNTSTPYVTGAMPYGHNLPVDREYACIFPLATPRDCTNQDYSVQEACDCSVPGLPLASVPSVCGLQNPDVGYAETSPPCEAEPCPTPAKVNDYTTQYYAKAYPTIRELELAELMGAQGIISSLCPINTTDTTSPVYGYLPAVSAIVNRLKNALATQCLPEQLTPDSTGIVQCLILTTLADQKGNEVANESSVCNNPKQGLSVPDPTILKTFQKSQHDAWVAAGNASLTDPSTLATCEVAQIPYVANQTCATSENASGWCYVAGKLAGTCNQAIQFTASSPPAGSTVSLQCIEAELSVVPDAGGGG